MPLTGDVLVLDGGVVGRCRVLTHGATAGVLLTRWANYIALFDA